MSHDRHRLTIPSFIAEVVKNPIEILGWYREIYRSRQGFGR
jgi:hypothetical protein